MIKTNKKLSLLLVLAMLMTMFVGAGTASAAGITYSPLNVPTYETKNSPQTEDATILIKAADAIVFGDKKHIATVTLPSGTEFVTPGSEVTLEVISTDPGFKEVNAVIKSSKTADLYVDATNGPFNGEVRFLLTFSGLVVKSGSGDLKVDFSAPAGSAFNFAKTEIAYIGGTSSISVKAGLPKKIGENGGYINGITISESVPGVLKEGDTITFKLENGFTWKDTTRIVAAGGWAFEGYNGMGASVSHDFNVTISGRELVLTIRNLPDYRNSAGRIVIGTDELKDIYPTGVFPFIEIDDGTRYGDIKISVSSSNSNVEINTHGIASFGDFGISLRAAMTKEVMSGRSNQELSNFFIKEEIAYSIKEGQTIYFELPEGVKWAGYGTIEIDGTDVISAGGYTPVSGSNGRKIKNVFTATTSKPTSLAFKNMKVNIEPWFDGPLDITVSGTVDVSGTITVAEALKPVEFTVEGTTNVSVGAMDQKAGDIIITEAEAGAIQSKADHNQLFITLPAGVTFSSKPTVEVISGDLDLGEVKIGSASSATGDNGLLINIDYSGIKKSAIKISDIYLTLDRTVPHGIVLAKFEGVKDFGWADGSTALVDFNTAESIGSIGIATTTTGSLLGTASFVIGSKTFLVEGTSESMDVAPFIKDDRSFVPVRYLAENMLGATVVWNEAAQQVILKNGGVEVVLTIGSKTYTVNGVEKTADVAPVIVDSRTFLPARYVAEAFGAAVVWEETTQTVRIQK
ncbi:MAG: copper amine oxidase N-terminal domain-containing protein [Syntrophomonadaceae bacterium]|nr:copper amine oxidase N-terminal domain-containing protein [Syntrophomonadaceae bacterium]